MDHFHNILISQSFFSQGGLRPYPYKGKNIDSKEIGKELGVRYVLEGSPSQIIRATSMKGSR